MNAPARHFACCISTDDRELDEMIEVDPYVISTLSRRSDNELARMLDLIGNLPISDGGEDGSA